MKKHATAIISVYLMSLLFSSCQCSRDSSSSRTCGGAFQLSINGINIESDTEYNYGQFANGDYWVVGPVDIKCLYNDEASNTINNHVGIMINPRMSQEQGYDSRINGYSSSLAVTVPFTAHPGDSVVFTTSLKEEGGNEGTYLADAAVITIVDAPLTADKFRPPYTRPTRVTTGSSDPLIFSTSDINWDLLLSLTKPASTPPLAETERLVERVWLDHWEKGSFLSSRIHPLNNMRDYGRDIAADESEVVMQLMLDYSQEEKTKLLISMIQVGIDFYGNALDGGVWHADGGHNSGRKFPIMFAGLMLDNNDMINISRGGEITNDSLGVTAYRYRFAEDGQTYYYDDPYLPLFANRLTNEHDSGPATGNVVAVRNTPGWIDIRNSGPGDTALWRISEWFNGGSYVAEHEHLDIDDWQDYAGGNDSHPKSDSYRRCCTAKAWIGYGLALNLMGSGARSAWGHDAFFDYIYRFMEEDDSLAATAFEARYSTPYGASQGSSLSQFVDDMWDMHSSDYTYPLYTP